MLGEGDVLQHSAHEDWSRVVDGKVCEAGWQLQADGNIVLDGGPGDHHAHGENLVEVDHAVQTLRGIAVDEQAQTQLAEFGPSFDEVRYFFQRGPAVRVGVSKEAIGAAATPVVFQADPVQDQLVHVNKEQKPLHGAKFRSKQLYAWRQNAFE